MNRIFSISILFMLLSAAFSSFALSPSDQAYSLFQRRSNIADAQKAREIYASIINDTHANLDLRLDAMTKYGRLALWEGAVAKHLSKIDDKAAAKLFKGCMELTENLSHKKIKKDVAEYAYWRAVCIGLWAANIKPAKVAIHIGKIMEIKDLVELGQKKFPEFDNFGFDRIRAGMLFRSKALSILKLYNPEEALKTVDNIISKGTNIYMTFVLKAEILVHLGRKEEAKKALNVGIAELADKLVNNGIPQDLVLENVIFLSNMKDALKSL